VPEPRAASSSTLGPIEPVADTVALESAAIDELESAATSDVAQLRANAIEALHEAPERIAEYARLGLADENRGVRFVAAMTVGKLRLESVASLAEPLLLDESESVQAAAIYALHRCGRDVDLNPLARMLRSNSPEVRGNVALVLGELGNSSAAPMIEQAMGRGMELAAPSRARIVDIQLAEALVRLGKVDHVQSVRATLFLPPDQQEITALACLVLGRLQDEGARGGLMRLIDADGAQKRPAEVRLAAAMALAQIGEQVPSGIAYEYVENTRPEVRHQAAMTLGEIGSLDSLPVLRGMMADANPLVRVAAAGAILRILRS